MLQGEKNLSLKSLELPLPSVTPLAGVAMAAFTVALVAFGL